MTGQRRRRLGDELSRPAIEFARRVVIKALDRPRHVGQFLGRIREGKELRPRVDLAARLVVDDALDREPVLDRQRPRRAGKRSDGDAIVERIVQPAEPPRLRIDVKLRRQEPLIVPVARTHHHPMVAELDRPRVAVGGRYGGRSKWPCRTAIRRSWMPLGRRSGPVPYFLLACCGASRAPEICGRARRCRGRERIAVDRLDTGWF